MRLFRAACRSVLFTLALLVLAVFPRAAAAWQATGSEARAVAPPASIGGDSDVWRLRIREAAAVQGDMVRLGDIADPLGGLSRERWEELAASPLWPAPPAPGRPLQINRQRLESALKERLGELAASCILPASLVIQRGGAVYLEPDLRALVIRALTPQINLLGGHGDLTDFRLPAYAFTAHEGQSIELERGVVAPGRIGLRFAVKELDGTARRRFTGSVFLNLWMDVPCAAVPLNRGDAVSPDRVTFRSENLAYTRGAIWDGKGGPWQAKRAIGVGEAILADDLAPLAAIHRGDRVTLVYRRGNVEMRTMVEALEEGGPGDTIAVRNLSSKKQVYATVRDADTVETK